MHKDGRTGMAKITGTVLQSVFETDPVYKCLITQNAIVNLRCYLSTAVVTDYRQHYAPFLHRKFRNIGYIFATVLRNEHSLA
jgi:hypothetical protein